MAAWGGFDLTAGLQGLQQIGDRFTQLRDELEHSIEETIRTERFGVLPGDAEGSADGGPEGWGGASAAGSPLAAEAPGGSVQAGDAAAPTETLPVAAAAASAADPADDAPAERVGQLTSSTHEPASLGQLAAGAVMAAEEPQQLDFIGADVPAADGEATEAQQPSGVVQPAPASAAPQEVPPAVDAAAQAVDAAAAAAADAAAPAAAQAASPTAADAAAVAATNADAAAEPVLTTTPDGFGSVVPAPQPVEPAPAMAAASSLPPTEAASLPAAPSVDSQPSPKQSPPPAAAAAPQQQVQRESAQQGKPSVPSVPSVPSAERVPVQGSGDEESLDAPALRRLVAQLREALAVRERQIERKGEEVAQMAEVTAALQKRNEELAQAKDREAVAELQREFEGKLAAAERKVYALTKERDALKRGSEKLSGMDDLVREKDAIIKQVMEEGETLSKKQLAQEQTIKKLRGQARDFQAQAKELAAALDAERSKAASAVSERASTAGELYALREQHAAELAAERQHYDRLLEEAREAQAAAESKAAESAKLGAARRLKEAEARVESLEGVVAELRAELERQRAASDEREELLSGEVSDLQRRCAEAEARQQEAAARIPEATQAIMRQLEAMQAAASQQGTAWAEAERGLLDRLRQAESAAGGAAGQAAHLGRELEEARQQLATATEQLSALRAALSDTQQAADMERQRRVTAETTAGHLRSDLASAQESLNTLEKVYAQQIDSLQARESSALSSVRALESKLKSGSSNGSAAGDAPPALAAPGFKWVLVKEGQEPAAGVAAGPGGNVGAAASSAWLSRQASSAAGSAAGDPAGDAAGQQDGAAAAAAADDESFTVGGSLLWGASAARRSTSGGSLLGGLGVGRPREPQLAALQQQIRELESTRGRLSEELVRCATEAAAGQAALAAASAAEAQARELGRRLAAAVELLGEKEELLEEAQADMAEMRDSYRKQIDFMAQQLTAAPAADAAR